MYKVLGFQIDRTCPDAVALIGGTSSSAMIRSPVLRRARQEMPGAYG